MNNVLAEVLVTAIDGGASAPGSPEEAVLSGRQLSLYRALAKQNAQIAAMYMGAVTILRHTPNPDRLALAAHGMRELLEKLPRVLDVPIPEDGSNLMQQARVLHMSWSKAKDKSPCLQNPTPSTEVDNHLRKYLGASEKFFTWFENSRPTRKQQAAKVVRSLDPQKRGLPQPIESLRIEEWTQCREYFELVSHHTTISSEEEFAKWVDVSEIFLLDRLVPRTFDDLSALDKIIGEGEANG